MNQQWTIADERTRFCVQAMRAHSGEWVSSSIGWVFRSEADHANALADLYRATRATCGQRERLMRMVVDGTARAAWGIDLDELDPWWLEVMEDREAQRLIALGTQARRVLGVHPLEDMPEEVGDDRFDASEFEARAEAQRARVRRAM
jgi:hypothetical protein